MDVESEKGKSGSKGRGKTAADRAKAATAPVTKAIMPTKPRRSSGAWEVAMGSEDAPPEKVLGEMKDLTMDEMRLVIKHRERKEEAADRKMKSAALTGWGARYPSLSNVWSDDLTFNVMRSTQS